MPRIFISFALIFVLFLIMACSGKLPEKSAVTPLLMKTEKVSFTANNLSLSALLDTPASGEAEALVIFVHGYGATNVVEQNWYYDLRSRFASKGISSFVWDKPGNGQSEGIFDINQSIESSAAEVVAAAQYLREKNVPGMQKIGLWGISRAGWIAPLAIAQDDKIDFWISVSGVDSKESFGYLLQSNWHIKGYSEAQIRKLYGQWLEGNRIASEGGAYQQYINATPDLRSDPFMQYMSGDTHLSETAYESWVESTQNLNQPIDPETGLAIYVENFEDILKNLDIDMLALFGEKDSSVNWQSTKQLYQKTVGENPEASLSIVTFPEGNHNMHRSVTGGFEEMIEILNNPEIVEGYYDAILTWLDETVHK